MLGEVLAPFDAAAYRINRQALSAGIALLATIAISTLVFVISLTAIATPAYAAVDESALSASGIVAGGSLATETGQSSINAQASSGGNLDSYAQLPKHIWILAFSKTSASVKVYSSRSKKRRVIGTYRKGMSVVVDKKYLKTGVHYKWLRVKLKGKARGYVRLKKVKLKKLDTKTFGLDSTNKANRKRIKACRYALPYIGISWRSSGSSMKNGVSCARLVCKALRSAGKNISNRTSYQLSKKGRSVKRKALKPGDVVFYSTTSNKYNVHHSGIYLGHNLIINSSAHFGSRYPGGGISIFHIDYRRPHARLFKRFL